MSGRWFRMYDELLDDPKVQMLPAETFKMWVNLLCLASRNDGRLPDSAAIAFALRVDGKRVDKILAELIDRRLIDEAGDGFEPHSWHDRQYKSDVSTDRVKRHREQRRNVSATVSNGVSRNVSDPTLERPGNASRGRAGLPAGLTDTETDTERKKETRAALASDFENWWKIYPHKVGKDAAVKAFAHSRKNTDAETLINGVKQYIANKPTDRPWCNPATWLNQGRWKDEPANVVQGLFKKNEIWPSV